MYKTLISTALLATLIFGGWQYWQTYDTPEYEKKWGWLPTTHFIPLWERKIDTQQTLKLGLITDTHVHPNRINRENKSDDAPRHLGSDRDARPLALFNAQMQRFHPDAIIHAGDVIEGTNDEDFVGKMGLDLVQGELEKTGVPVYWVVGNHDLRSVTKAQFRDTLELTPQHREADKVIDRGDYRIILLDANYYTDGRSVEPGGKRHIPGYLHPDTLAWLEQQLDTDKHVYIIMHQGAFDAVVRQGETADVDEMITRATDKKKKEHLEKQRDKGKASITNAQDFRTILEHYNVDTFINGHLEVARYDEIGGVRYYSLTGTKKSNVFPESFYEMIITAGAPHLTMHYTDPVSNVAKIVNFEKTMLR